MLRQAGLDLERNTGTTTNFERFSADEISTAVENRRTEGFDFETCYVAHDRKFVDVICWEWGMCDDNALHPSSSAHTDM